MSQDKSTPATPFYQFDYEGRTFGFRRPRISELDLVGTKARKVPVSSSLQFTQSIICDADKEAWNAHLDTFPGSAARVSTAVMELLNFPTD
jgi:hypothetical protein